MKKLILILFVAMFAASCEGPMGPEGPEGPRGRDGKVTMTEHIFEINQADWDWVPASGGFQAYYKYPFTFPELTEAKFFGGIQKGYLLYSDGLQQELPCYQFYEDGEGAKWSRNLDYECITGKITFFATNSNSAQTPPPTYEFRIMLAW